MRNELGAKDGDLEPYRKITTSTHVNCVALAIGWCFLVGNVARLLVHTFCMSVVYMTCSCIKSFFWSNVGLYVFFLTNVFHSLIHQ